MRLAIAFISSLAAVTAHAQSTVTIGGFADASVIAESGGAKGSLKKVGSGVSGPTRLIFRGSEDLGSGMSALFHLESGVLYDTGGSLQQNFFGRQSYVGLSGSGGTLRAGLQFTSTFLTLRDIGDPFKLAYAGNAGNLMSGGAPAGPRSIAFPNLNAVSGTVSTAGLNRANTVQYLTPNLSGFTADAAYSLGEQPGDNTRLRTVAVSAGYAQGPLTARAAYINTRNADGSEAARTAVAAGNYDFTVLKLYAALEENRAFGDVKSTEYLVGATVPAGPGQVIASFVKRNDKSVLDNDAHQIAIGYVYFLSKRTQLHASAARIKNSLPNTSPAFYTVSPPSGPGTGNKAVAVGISHFF